MSFGELDVDATPIRCRHKLELLRLGIKKLSNALQHLVGHGDGERQLQCVSAQVIIPLGFLTRIQPANEDVIVISIDWPRLDFLVGRFLVEVWLVPEIEEESLSNPVRRREVFAAVKENSGRVALHGCD